MLIFPFAGVHFMVVLQEQNYWLFYLPFSDTAYSILQYAVVVGKTPPQTMLVVPKRQEAEFGDNPVECRQSKTAWLLLPFPL